MSRITDLQRMEFINTLERLYGGVLARQELQVPALIEVLFEQRYDLDSPRDAGILISNLDTKIDTDLKEELFDYIGNGMRELAGIGVTHSISNSLNIMGDSAFDFLGIDQRLALDYINRVGVDGMRLSDRIWGIPEKEAITKEVYKAVENGDNAYKLAQNLETVVTQGTPRSSLTRIAKTELNYAYSHAKADTIIAEADYLPNAEAYIKVSLSPAHRIYDICDSMQGTYRANEAPLPSYHPNCLCRTETFLKVSGTQGRVDTLTRSLQSYRSEHGGKTPIKTIETYNKIVSI
jgi:hypothetical protein